MNGELVGFACGLVTASFGFVAAAFARAHLRPIAPTTQTTAHEALTRAQIERDAKRGLRDPKRLLR